MTLANRDRRELRLRDLIRADFEAQAARIGRKAVTQEDFEVAKDKVLMGVERRSLIISDEEKRATAFHEAGHAIIAQTLPNADPLHKVTIIPRGRALGVGSLRR